MRTVVIVTFFAMTTAPARADYHVCWTFDTESRRTFVSNIFEGELSPGEAQALFAKSLPESSRKYGALCSADLLESIVKGTRDVASGLRQWDGFSVQESVLKRPESNH